MNSLRTVHKWPEIFCHPLDCSADGSNGNDECFDWNGGSLQMHLYRRGWLTIHWFKQANVRLSIITAYIRSNWNSSQDPEIKISCLFTKCIILTSWVNKLSLWLIGLGQGKKKQSHSPPKKKLKKNWNMFFFCIWYYSGLIFNIWREAFFMKK